MKLAHALRLVDMLKPIRGKGRGARQGCVYLINGLIKRATKAQVALAIGVSDVTTTRNLVTGWAPIDELVTEQQTLSRDGLRKELRRFKRRQKTNGLPTVIRVQGGILIWDGNHRCNSAILLGRRRIRVRFVVNKRLTTNRKRG